MDVFSSDSSATALFTVTCLRLDPHSPGKQKGNENSPTITIKENGPRIVYFYFLYNPLEIRRPNSHKRSAGTGTVAPDAEGHLNTAAMAAMAAATVAKLDAQGW